MAQCVVLLGKHRELGLNLQHLYKKLGVVTGGPWALRSGGELQVQSQNMR